MFKIKGYKGDRRVTITWDDGSISDPDALKFVVKQMVQFADESRHQLVTPFQQECTASLADSVFCFWQLHDWLDVVEEVTGDTGVISEEGVVY